MSEFEKALIEQNAILIRQIGQIAADLRRMTLHITESEQAKEKVRQGPMVISPSSPELRTSRPAPTR